MLCQKDNISDINTALFHNHGPALSTQVKWSFSWGPPTPFGFTRPHPSLHAERAQWRTPRGGPFSLNPRPLVSSRCFYALDFFSRPCWRKTSRPSCFHISSKTGIKPLTTAHSFLVWSERARTVTHLPPLLPGRGMRGHTGFRETDKNGRKPRRVHLMCEFTLSFNGQS